MPRPGAILYLDAEPSGLGGRDLTVGVLPSPGDPVPELALPEGDVGLGNGTVLRCVQRPFMVGPRTKDGAVWDERPGRDGDRRKGLRVIATLDLPSGHGDQWLLHVSLSLPGSYPSWRQIKLVKAAFYGPDVDACMVLPMEADFVNVHPNTFQLWQLPRVWGIR